MIKRLFDLIVAFTGLVLLSPFFLLIALAIKLDSRGAVFYHGARVGKDGRPFRIVKFRTMITDAARRGPGITVSDDPRITRVGAWLRRAKIDELPQLINVVRGEMSLVGPRPEDPAYVAQYTAEQRRVLSVRPGITSPASLIYRDEQTQLTGKDWESKYVREIMPAKIAIELDYIDRQTVISDLGWLARTVFALIR